MAELKRPGISHSTLEKAGIEVVDADEAYRRTGCRRAGLYIPYLGVEVDGRPFGRLRLFEPRDGQKYHSPAGSGVHIYIPEDLQLYGRILLVVEGEFKALSLCEAGFPAIGTCGFYSWSVKRGEQKYKTTQLQPAFEDLMRRLDPAEIVYIGDADTAVNFSFADAMVKLGELTKIPVGLLRIPYGCEHGKGVDDIRESLGASAFNRWFLERFHSRLLLSTDEDRFSLMVRLLEMEERGFSELGVAERLKAAEKLAKTCWFADPIQINHFAKTAKKLFGTNVKDFVARAEESRSKNMRDLSPARRPPNSQGSRIPQSIGSGGGGSDSGGNEGREEAPAMDSSVFDRVLVVGKEFFAYSVHPGTGEQSKVLSICDRSYASKCVKIAGYTPKARPSPDDPICKRYPGLSPYEAAMAYLHETRCTRTVTRLFKPYGRIVESDGTCVFNNANITPLPPQGIVDYLHDERIACTYAWLLELLGEDQLTHFLTVVSYLYIAARRQDPKKTLALFFVGPPSSGKSFLIDYVLPRIFGQTTAADASRLFKGENGASSVLSTFVLKMSDRDIGDGDAAKRMQTGILYLLADHTITGKLMYQNVTTEEVYNLFAFSSNYDGSVINLLRDMPESTRSKMAIYNCRKGLPVLNYADPMFPSGSEEDPRRFVDPELPFFCSLLENWPAINPAYMGHFEPRYGVFSYASRAVYEAIKPRDDEQYVFELLLKCKIHGIPASGVAREVRRVHSLAFLSHGLDMRMGRVLRAIAVRHPRMITVREYEKNTLYDIDGSGYAEVLAAEQQSQTPRRVQQPGQVLWSDLPEAERNRLMWEA